MNFVKRGKCCIVQHFIWGVFFVPGLLSLSSLSSRPPATPRSLDWSCMMIFSLLLIRHTELLAREHEQDVSPVLVLTARRLG